MGTSARIASRLWVSMADMYLFAAAHGSEAKSEADVCDCDAKLPGGVARHHMHKRSQPQATCRRVASRVTPSLNAS